MLKSQEQLEHSVKALGKMYSLRDREAAETLWDLATRDDVVEGTVSMIRKIEREIAVYLAQKYELVTREAEKVA
jgi:hypothetical protein